MADRVASLSSRLQAKLDLRERLKQPYMPTWRDRALDEHFDQMIIDLHTRRNTKRELSSENVEETAMVAVVGDSGAGKSRTLDRAFERNDGIMGGSLANVTLRVSMPAPASLRTWGLEMVRATKFPVSASTPEKEVWVLLRKRLEFLGVKIVRIDEFQNVTKTADKRQIVDIRATLKDLLVSETHPIALVVSGLRDFLPQVQAEREIARRMRVIDLLPLRMPHDGKLVATAIKTLTEVANVSVSETTIRTVSPRLLHTASHQLGETIKLIRNAVERAHSEGALELALSHFAADYLFRTANCAASNPFLAKDWRKVDVLSLAVRESDAPKLVANRQRKV